MRSIDPNKAVDFMLEHAEKYAKAKANRIQIEEFRKSKKALLMNQCSAETVNAREQFAYSHSEYIQLIEGLKEAVEIEESLRWKMTAAQMRVEIWRSLEATARAEGRATQ
jgi:hypothetical protein